MNDIILDVRGLDRRFEDVHAVRHLSFSIRRGEVVGFIGANGAGKTTTMRCIVTLDEPDGGSIWVDGFNAAQSPLEVRRRVGWMPDSYGTYDHVLVWEYLDFFARAFGYRGEERRARVAEVMEFTDLTPIADRQMNKLSKGMGQRLCLGRTLLHDPPLLVLDEPAAGLDPKARIEFKRLVRLLAEQGKTLFISSHILSELEEMCDSLLFIDQGALVHQGTAEGLKEQESTEAVVAVEVEGDPQALATWVQLQPGVALVEATRRGARLRLADGRAGDRAALLRAMVQQGLSVTEFKLEQARLEDAFVSILSRQPAVPPPLPPQGGQP